MPRARRSGASCWSRRRRGRGLALDKQRCEAVSQHLWFRSSNKLGRLACQRPRPTAAEARRRAVRCYCGVRWAGEREAWRGAGAWRQLAQLLWFGSWQLGCLCSTANKPTERTLAGQLGRSCLHCTDKALIRGCLAPAIDFGMKGNQRILQHVSASFSSRPLAFRTCSHVCEWLSTRRQPRQPQLTQHTPGSTQQLSPRSSHSWAHEADAPAEEPARGRRRPRGTAPACPVSTDCEAPQAPLASTESTQPRGLRSRLSPARQPPGCSRCRGSIFFSGL